MENAKITNPPTPAVKKDDPESLFNCSNVPVEEQIILWRKKLHDVYEDSENKLQLLIETNVCKSNKKAKKRFSKIRTSDEFYGKHVW